MSSKLITLYVIPTKLSEAPGTLTTWRATYSLNIKNLPYQTVFVKLPDTEPLAKRIGCCSYWYRSDRVTSLCTVPIFQDHATGAVVSESVAITEYLDKTYPCSGPTLIPTGMMTLHLAFRDGVRDHFAALCGFMTESIAPNMNDKTVALWKTRLAEWAGFGKNSKEQKDIITWNSGNFAPYETIL
ncbi:hypothetical protein DFS33DRAFT_1454661 [Desarmillaria ectypa]|nr:hypothetical protein DFS33DRAFT_1454661 [Desarmillaria ectypa]